MAAATPYWAKRSMRLDHFLSMKSVGSKSVTSAAIFTGYSVVSKRWIWSNARAPRAAQCSVNTSFPIPMADTTPMPVTTTRLYSTVLVMPLTSPSLPVGLDTEPTVDRQDGPGDERRRVAGQEGHCLRHRLRCADATQRNVSR